jgi:capsular polysaccharide biosynthesis protein
MMLDIDALKCASLIDGACGELALRCESGATPFASAGKVVCARDVLYVPELRLQVIDGRIVPQEAVPEPWTLAFEIGRGFEGRADRYRGDVECIAVSEAVCILSNFYSRNFYHFVTEELPKVVILERHGFSGRYVLASLPGFAGQFMDILGVERDRVITEMSGPAVFAEVHYTASIHGWNVLEHRDVMLAVRDGVLGAAIEVEASPRLWIERRAGVNNKGRELVNAEEVYGLLQRYGFEVVDMAAMPLRKQLGTARGAAALAGPHGAGFVHALFQEPASAVIECFSPQFINPGVLDICRLMSHRYSMLVHGNAYGSYPFGDQLKIDLSQLDLALQGLQ